MLRPPSPRHPNVIHITLAGSTIRAYLGGYIDALPGLLKSLHYQWHRPYWERDIRARNGNIEDRAADLCRHLLAAGFCVEPPNEAVAQKTVSGEYEPECVRWILAGKYGQLLVSYPRDDPVHRKALRITGAHWVRGIMVMPVECYAEVEDFAAQHGFRWTDQARELAAVARAGYESAWVVNVAAPEPEHQTSRRPTLNDGPVEIHDALLDEPL